MVLKRAKLFLFWCVTFLVSFYGTGPAYTETSSPERIISLAPAITEALYLLGVEDKIVGVTTYCKRPPSAQKKEKIGSVIRVNIEKIVSLEPDLVLDLSMADPQQVEKLKNLGIRVVSFAQPSNFSGICEQFLELGKILGKENEACQIVDTAKDKIDSIKKKVEKLHRPRVFVQLGAKPLVTVTKDSFINDFIQFSGGINISLGADIGLYNREEVLRKNPDVIIIVTMGILGEEERKTWLEYKSLNAVKFNRIYILDSYKICSPTPLSFVEALEEIVRILHVKGKR